MADKLICLKDFENHALNKLTPNVRDYYQSGAGDEDTLKWNRSAFKKLRLRPRILRDVTSVDLSTTILGEKVSMPLGVSPTAMQKLAHPDGECANVRAVEAAKTIHILSTVATSSIEEVAQAAPQAIKWFQLYVYTDRNVTLNLVSRAEKAGFKAIVLTVDTPILGDRRTSARNELLLPNHLKLANLEDSLFKNVDFSKINSNPNKYINDMSDKSLTWDDIVWFKSITKLPIILKGILTSEDAIMGVKHGASAIFVSNHGARQLDGVPASIEALPEIVKAVGDKVEVYIDGGISQGTDVFKALALGAKMVFVGRPMLWGLSCGGEDGARAVLEIMRREIDKTFALMGCSSIQEITKNMVVHESTYSRL